MRNEAEINEIDELWEFESPETREFNRLLKRYFAQMHRARRARRRSGIDIILVPRCLLEKMRCPR